MENIQGKINKAKESMSHAFKDVETANEHMLMRYVSPPTHPPTQTPMSSSVFKLPSFPPSTHPPTHP